MSKFIVVVFPNESKAYEATRALKELHNEFNLTLYGMAVVSKDSNGRVSIKEAADQGPLGMGVGALVGGLVGLVAGPAGAAVGFGTGAVLGGINDLYNAGIGADFLETVWARLAPGKTAVVADIDEDWVTPLDTRMEALGGTLIREWRVDYVDEQIEKEMKAREAELAQLKAEFAQAREESKAKLRARMEEVQKKLGQAVERTQKRIDQLDKEVQAKITQLQDQAAKARGEAKARIDRNISELREDYKWRTDKLRKAWQLTKEALAA
jgi:uncharacterized membrane protein